MTKLALFRCASCAFILAGFLAGPASAQTQTPPPTAGFDTSSANAAPLEITANGSLEWLREKKTFIARINAMAAQGPSNIKANTLIAEYREGSTDQQGGSMQIWRVSAQQNVVLTSNDSQAYGDDAVYDLDRGLATLTGENLKIVMPDQTITARDKFEYWVTDGRMNALGAAKVVRKKPEGGVDIMEADKISAVFKDNASGQRELHSLEAIGNVKITTPQEVITGAYGIYRAGANTAEMTGGVKITRGPNTLEGNRAEVDLATNTSKIFGAPAAGQPAGAPVRRSGKVKAVFYPGSEKTQTPTNEKAP